MFRILDLLKHRAQHCHLSTVNAISPETTYLNTTPVILLEEL